MHNDKEINRRSFLRLCGLQLAALAIPAAAGMAAPAAVAVRPAFRLRPDALPVRLQTILRKVPAAWIDRQGLLYIRPPGSTETRQVPLQPTIYNLENRQRWHRLEANAPWGIVLHWYGDKDGYDRSVAGYLRGFDSLRNFDGELIRTSAHFVVGRAVAGSAAALDGRQIGYLQTQLPAADGVPYMGAHLAGLDYEGYAEGEQYFIKALDRLTYANPRNRHLLQEMYKGWPIDPNRRTIGIEIAGHHFDQPGNLPEEQQIANVLGLVRALMLRYRLPANSLMGHHELSLGKPDPGKSFLALIRYLIGVLALTGEDSVFHDLVFGQYFIPGVSQETAYRRYFDFVRDYLVLTNTPARLYRWEGDSHYWLLADLLPGVSRNLPTAAEYITPLAAQTALSGNVFLRPESHEGIDLYTPGTLQKGEARSVRLIAPGECLYAAHSYSGHNGMRAIFRHRQPDGAEFLTVYAHLDELPELETGALYPAGYSLGITEAVRYAHAPFLHFAMGYGAAWETSLAQKPDVPLNAGYSWIRQHFMDPLAYDFQRYRMADNPYQRSYLFD